MNHPMNKKTKIIIVIAAVGLAVIVLLAAAELAFFIQFHDFYFKKSFSLAADKARVTNGSSLNPPLEYPYNRIRLKKDSFSQKEAGIFEYTVDVNQILEKIPSDAALVFAVYKDPSSLAQLQIKTAFIDGNEEKSHSYEWGKGYGFIFSSIQLPINRETVKRITLSIETKEMAAIEDLYVLVRRALPEAKRDSANRLYRQPINFQKGKRLRIICIGESTTYGVGASRVATWPFMLQLAFDVAYPNRFDVMNLGREGQFIEEYNINLIRSSFIHHDYFRDGDKDYQFILSQYLNHSAGFGWKDLKADIALIVPVWNDMTNVLLEKVKERLHVQYKRSLFYRFTDLMNRCPVSNRLALGYYIKKMALIRMENYLTSKRISSLDLSSSMGEIERIYKNDLIEFISRFREYLPQTKIYLVSLPGLFVKQSYTEYEMSRYRDSFPIRYSKRQLEFYAAFQGLVEQRVRAAMKDIARKESGTIGFIEIPDVATENNSAQNETDSRLFYDPFHFTHLGNNMIVHYLFDKLVNTYHVVDPREVSSLGGVSGKR
jgi:hypothetical protein